MDENGIVDDFDLGNGINTKYIKDQWGYLDKIQSTLGTTKIQDWDYDYNATFGNITKRKGLNSSGTYNEEAFTYDTQNRLLTYTVGMNTMSLTYDTGGKGNITSKTDVGTYNYNTADPHQVENITNPTTLLQDLPAQNITYTKFDKVSSLNVTGTGIDKDLYITYGVDQQRVKTIYQDNSTTVLTKYFALGMYEKEIHATNGTRELFYINTPSGISAILESTASYDSLYYVHTDMLGSYDVITNQQGAVRERLSFDPWGRRRSIDNWDYNNVSTSFLFDRGFTGHEHLDDLRVINMNGRVYDPTLGMFISVDNHIQNPESVQNFNRYSYCLNNPLIYTDPSGEIIFTILSAIFCPGLLPVAIGTDIGWISGGIRGAKTEGMTFWDGAWRGGLVGAIGVGLSYIGGAGMPFAANLYLGIYEGALTGGLDAILWDNDIGKGMFWGAAAGALMTTFTSENMTNLFKGEGFYTNVNLYNNMIKRGMPKQDILDYFGLNATYRTSKPLGGDYVDSDYYLGSINPSSNKIYIGEDAFYSYSSGKPIPNYHNLIAVYKKELFTQNRIINGTGPLIWTEHGGIEELMKMKYYPEEGLAFRHLFRNQGLFPESSINFLNQANTYWGQVFSEPLIMDKTLFHKIRNVLFKLPRRW